MNTSKRLLISLTALTTAASLQAATLHWNGIGQSDAAAGGAGTWDLSANNWRTAATAGDSSTWTNATGDQAVFGGEAGAVNVDGSVNVNRLTFNTAGYTLSGGTLTLTGGTPTINTAADTTIASTIAGGNLTKSGNGVLTLVGANTYTGGTELIGGTLSFDDAAALGTGYLAIKNSAVLRYTGTGASRLATGTLWFDNGPANIDVTSATGALTLWRTAGTFNQQLIKTGAGTLRLGATGDNNGASAVVNGGVLESISSGSNNLAYVTVNNGGTFRLGTVDGAGAAINDNRQVWDGGSITVNTGGVYDLNGMKESTNTILSGGSIVNNTARASEQSGTMTVNSAAGAGGIGGSGDITLSGTLNGTGTFTKIGTGTVNLTSNINHTGAYVIDAGTLNFTTGSSRTIAGAISGAGTLAKSGAGVVNLNGGGSFSGQIRVNEGSLILGSTMNAVAGVTLADGVTLGVSGTGSLTTESLTLNGGATLSFGTITNYLADAAITTGSLTAAGGAGSIKLNLTTGPVLAGEYRLIDLGGATVDTSLFDITSGPTLSTRQSGSLQFSGGYLSFVVAGDMPQWTGLDGSEWIAAPTGPNGNWRLITEGTTTDYIQGDVVTFNDSAATTTVNIAENVTPVATFFDNSTKDYVLTGAQGITGAGSLEKSGTGTLTISAKNSYTGGTVLKAGTIAVTDAHSLGDASGALTFAGSGTLRTLATFTSSRAIVINGGALATIDTAGNVLTQTGVISGPGGLVKTGAGTLVLSSVNTYTGGTTVNEGTLRLTARNGGTGTIRGTLTANAGTTIEIGGEDVLGYGGGANAVNTINLNGATLVQTQNRNETNTAVINMTGGSTIAATGGANALFDLFGGSAAINSSGDVTNVITSRLNLRQNNSIITVNDGASAVDLRISGVISRGDSGNGILIKSGAGTLVLEGANTYNGGTEINGGTLVVNAMNGIGTGGLTIKNGATFRYDGTGTVTDTRALNVNSGGAKIQITNADAALTLSGTGSITGGDFEKSGAGALTISGATISGSGGLRVTGGSLTLANQNNYTGNTLVSGGTLFLTGGAGIYGNTKAGVDSLVINNGGVLVGDRWSWGAGNSLGQLNYNNDYIAVNNGTLRNVAATSTDFNNRGVKIGAGGATFENAVAGTKWTINSGGNNSSFASNARLTLAGVGDGAFQQVVSGSGVNIAKIGAGTWSLTGANTYTGGTAVTGGTLVAASAQALGTGSVSVASGAELRIGGDTATTVTLGSGANLVLAADAILSLGSVGSQLVLNGGSFMLDNAILDLGGVFDRVENLSSYQLITGTGSANNLTIIGYDTNAFSNVFFTDNGMIHFSAIPEPSTYGLMGAGALGAIALVRRRRKAKHAVAAK